MSIKSCMQLNFLATGIQSLAVRLEIAALCTSGISYSTYS